MEHRVSSWLVWLRASVVGSMFFLFGVVGHVSADGLLPGPVAMTLVLAVSVTLSGLFLAQRASTVRLVSMLVGGQLVVHLVLSTSGGHRGESLSTATGGATAPRPAREAVLPTVDGRRVGSLFDATQVPADPQASPLPVLPVGHLVDDLLAHAPMMAAHVGAAALIGLWLAYGERTLWSLLALTGRRIAAVALVPVALPAWQAPRLVRPAARPDATRRSLWHSPPPALRGPPALVA